MFSILYKIFFCKYVLFIFIQSHSQVLIRSSDKSYVMMKKSLICFAVLFILFSLSFSTTAIKSTEQSAKNATIQGIVKEAVTCVPNALVYAEVSALSVFRGRFGDITDENGTFSLSVPPGLYFVFAKKDGYRQASPLLGRFVVAKQGEVVDISFMMKLRIIE